MRQWLPALGAQGVGVHVAREARSSQGAFLCRVDLCGHRHPPHPRGLPTQGEFSNPTLVFKFKISDFRPFTLKTGETEHMILSQCPPLSGLQFPHVGGGGWRGGFSRPGYSERAVPWKEGKMGLGSWNPQGWGLERAERG